MTNGYMVPPVYLTDPPAWAVKHEHAASATEGPLTELELIVALLKEHRKVMTGYLAPTPVCVRCSQQWPCKTMMLVCPGCRILWAHLWSPPRPVPLAREVATW